MLHRKHPDHPDITEEMWIKINEIITASHGKPGAVIPVLRECQNVIGYLPVEVMDYIARGLKVPGSDVFGVATFYSLFSMVPKGRHTIKVCLGTACYVKGIKEIVNRIKNKYQVKEGGTSEDRRFSLEAVRCLGTCGLAPVAVVDEDIYGNTTPSGMCEVLEKYT